jgi:putative inorganic carbon (hco3(-)) transporter
MSNSVNTETATQIKPAQKGSAARFPIPVICVTSMLAGVLVVLLLRFFPALLVLEISLLVVIACLLVYKIEMGILALVLVRSSLDALRDINVVSTSVADLNIAGLLSVLLIIAGTAYLISNHTKISQIPAAIPFAAFIFIAFASIATSSAKMAGVADWLRVASTFVLYLVVIQAFRSKRSLKRLVYAILFSSIIPLTVGAYQALNGAGSLAVTAGGQFERIFGTFGHPNSFGFYLVLVLTIAIPLFIENTAAAKKIPLALLIAACSIMLILTFARGAWIGMVVALIVMALIRYRKMFYWLPVVIIAAVILFPQIVSRFQDVVKGGEATGSFGWRLNFWDLGFFDLIRQRPLLGHGIGSFPFFQGNDAHNDYLRLAVEVGIPGLLLYLTTLYVVGKTTWQAIKKLIDPFDIAIAVSFLSLLAAYLVMSIADNLVKGMAMQWYFWVLAAVVLRTILNRRKEIQEQVA